MQAIQFIATLHDGVIKIPAKYQAQAEGEVKVVVLLNKPTPTRSKSRFLESIRKHQFQLPPDYQFDRESLYER